MTSLRIFNREAIASNKRPTLLVKGVLILLSIIFWNKVNSWDEKELKIGKFCGIFSNLLYTVFNKPKAMRWGCKIAWLLPIKGKGKKLAILLISVSLI